MSSTAQLVSPYLLGHKGHAILHPAIPRGRGHYKLPIRREHSDFVLVSVHDEHVQNHCVSLLHRHKSWGQRVAVDFLHLWGGSVRLTRSFKDVALRQGCGVDRWRRELVDPLYSTAFIKMVCVACCP
jgi:hypothetical protein